MKVKLLVLLTLASCASCPERIYRKCISEVPVEYSYWVGRSNHPLRGIHMRCEKYSKELYVDYQCKTYKVCNENNK